MRLGRWVLAVLAGWKCGVWGMMGGVLWGAFCLIHSNTPFRTPLPPPPQTLERKSQYDRQREEYKDQLDRKKLADQLQAQREMQMESLKKQEEAVLRQEKIRRETAAYEAELKSKADIAKAR